MPWAETTPRARSSKVRARVELRAIIGDVRQNVLGEHMMYEWIHPHSGGALDERLDDHAGDPIGVLAKPRSQPVEDRLPSMVDRVRWTLYVE